MSTCLDKVTLRAIHRPKTPILGGFTINGGSPNSRMVPETKKKTSIELACFERPACPRTCNSWEFVGSILGLGWHPYGCRDTLWSLVIARDSGMKHGPTSSMMRPCFRAWPPRYLMEDGDFPLQTVKIRENMFFMTRSRAKKWDIMGSPRAPSAEQVSKSMSFTVLGEDSKCKSMSNMIFSGLSPGCVRGSAW